LALGLLLALPALADDEGPSLTGAVGYSVPLELDLDRDGKPDRVQLWVDFEVKGESGTLGYYLLDLDSGKKVWNYMDIFMGQVPRKRRHAVRNVVFDGKTVLFKAVGMSWRVTDGGPGFKHDRIQVAAGRAKRDFKLQAGDVTVKPKAAKPKSAKPKGENS